MFPAPRVYLITDRRAPLERPLTEVVAAALAGAPRGADGRSPVAVQLREKDMSGADLLELAKRLRAITAAARAPLFINDRVDVALACDADGVHLPSGGLLPADVRRVAPHLAIAASTHSSAEISIAREADFVVFGPVFATPSKARFGPPKGLGALVEAVERAGPTLPVLALGGVDLANVAECRASGAAGIACIRSVLCASDPAQQIAMFLRCFV